ncbi:DNA polymerase ligase N-terminal domain-containing protein [Jiangella anatolica]|nr:DNA polymerase ligase N-terminal domain-containing protein [Jiangella anatolica]
MSDDESSGGRFVVHEHHARRLHWDLRVEHDGVLASWALPRGFPRTPEENRLAVRTDDHPMEFLTFDGEIPAGEYGGGAMTIWDHGTYTAEKFRDDKVVARFDGERVQGRFALFRTRGDDWMIHRMDGPADDGEPLPESLAPMTATPGALPRDQDAWAFEVDWDGARTLAYADPGRLRLADGDGRDVTRRYPELRPLTYAVGARRLLLDGELVAFGADGRPSATRLRRRVAASDETDIRRRAETAPVVYVVYDLLHLDGRSLLDAPYEERRRELTALRLAGSAWQVPDHQRGDGDVLLEAARQQGLAGVVAKRLDSPYRPGRRSRDWRRITA